MQRRTFIAAGAWLSTTAAWPASWALRWPHADALHADLALVDTALAESGALLQHASRMRVHIVDLDATPHADIATLWYETLAPRAALAARSGARLSVIGVTRAADFFVLARLAQQPAAALPQMRSVLQRAAIAFALRV
ncbi:hypothetical protein [Paraburkholderia sp. C35]|uniref:hypothetical protein n=1 Tax=Paraburkholderia sp. C35 TaxID=2126993 RepID=UPI000D68EF67|nr:hypothetical protein [Paraburkholderia sp. C35]